MRFTTLASIALIAASTAALAQVASGPDEQKVPAAGANVTANDVAPATPEAAGATRNDAVANTTTPPADDMAPATPADEPKTNPRPRRR